MCRTTLEWAAAAYWGRPERRAKHPSIDVPRHAVVVSMVLAPGSIARTASVRLPPALAAQVEELARQWGVRPSDILRIGAELLTDPNRLAEHVAVQLASEPKVLPWSGFRPPPSD
jgi:hypothetical protein